MIQLVVGLSLLSISPSSARILRVKSGALGAGTGDSWEDAFPELYLALGEAVEGDEIRIASGTYLPSETPSMTATFNLVDGVRLRGGYEGIDDDEEPSHVTAVETQTILSGAFPNSTPALHVVSAINLEQPTSLESIVITEGRATFSLERDGRRGGGILCDSVQSLTLRNVALIDNFATSTGGAIYSRSSNLTLVSSLIGGNYGGDGGGLYFGASSSARIFSCIFSGNQGGDEGGAIFVGSGSLPEIELNNCTITENRSASGAGLWAPRDFVKAYNCIFWRNQSQRSILGVHSPVTGSPFSVATARNTIIQGAFFLGLDPPNLLSDDPEMVNPAGDDQQAGTLDDDVTIQFAGAAFEGGDNSLVPEEFALDFFNRPRIAGVNVDIGAIELTPLSFETLFPDLDPEGDDNQNGFTNFFDYAAGGDPTAPHDPSLMPRLEGRSFVYSIRNNSLDASMVLQRSFDLQSWTEAEEGSDYFRFLPPTSDGDRNIVRLSVAQPVGISYFLRGCFKRNE